jgi:hypothetical protein
MLTVSEVLELVPGDDQNATWINPGFIGYVKNVTITNAKKSGKPMHICTLCDPDGSYVLGMTVFTPTIPFAEGDTIEVSGKGLRRTEFNGNAQATPGRETEIRVVQAPNHAAPARKSSAPASRDDSRGGNPEPAAEPAHDTEDRAVAFHQRMTANATLYLQCLTYARKINISLKAGGHPLLEGDHFQACVSTLFIAGDRQGLAVMPPPPAKKAEPAPAPKPAPRSPVENEDLPF